MRFIFFGLLSSILLSSCANQNEKPTKSTPQDSVAQECFQFVIKNKTKEFINHIGECKEARDHNGLSVFLMVIAKENIDLVEALIEAKVDVNQVDGTGATALGFAANKNNVRIVQLLRRAGARVEVVNNNLSGLMLAARHSSLELIEVMNPSVEEINLRAEDGWSAIYFAISRNDPDILKYLLDHGACIQQWDSYQQRPIDFARELEWKKGVTLLQNRKAKC